MRRAVGKGHWLGGGLVLVALAVAAFVLLESDDGGPSRPITYSVRETKQPCIGGSYLPEHAARSLLDRPPPKSWHSVQDDPLAVFANSDTVQVTIRSGYEDAVILEGIHFEVKKGRRPPGLTFYRSCVFRASGNVLEAALDSSPPELSGEVGFPWSVSLEKPLTLYVVARSLECHCRWRAKIPWRSDGARGVLEISEGGKAFEVTFSGGMNAYVAGKDGWELL